MHVNEMLVALGIPIGSMALAAVIVGLVGYFKNQERRQRHETIRLALEKGQPLPPGLIHAEPVRNDLAGGIRMVFLGLGVGAFLWIFRPEQSLWGIGLMLAIMGVGRLVAHFVSARSQPTPPGTSAT